MSTRYLIAVQTGRTMGGVFLACLLTAGLSFAEEGKSASSRVSNEWHRHIQITPTAGDLGRSPRT